MFTLAARSGRLALAVAMAVALVLAAPYVGVVRSGIRDAFPGQFSLIINGLIGVSLLIATGLGLARVRDHRVTRYGAMALALVAAATYAVLTGSPDPAVNAVERFHFVEYGTITFLFYRVWRDRGDASALVMPAIAAFIVGVADEGFQWFLPARVGELKDVWLNGVAIACGLLFSVGAAPMPALRRSLPADAMRLVTRTIAVGVLALAAFVHVVHLGVAISDPDAGTFVSRNSPEELAALDRSRASAWKAEPPLVRPPRLSREDQFITEGLQHVKARNDAWTAGQPFAAWRENLILERYFPSVLDTPSYVDKNGHRWAAAQRADAEARVAGTAAQAFESAAYPYPLYLWPPFWLWVVAVSVATLLWLAEPLARRALGARWRAGAVGVLLALMLPGIGDAPGLWRYRFAQAGHSATELVRYADDRYLVIERDNRHGTAAVFKRVFAIRLTDPGAFVEKTLVVDLLAIADPDGLGGLGPRFTFPFITTEAVWAEDDRTIVLANDNNYPATGGRVPGERDGTEFIRLRLSRPLPR
jgi:VanZ family protein